MFHIAHQYHAIKIPNCITMPFSAAGHRYVTDAKTTMSEVFWAIGAVPQHPYIYQIKLVKMTTFYKYRLTCYLIYILYALNAHFTYYLELILEFSV